MHKCRYDNKSNNGRFLTGTWNLKHPKCLYTSTCRMCGFGDMKHCMDPHDGLLFKQWHRRFVNHSGSYCCLTCFTSETWHNVLLVVNSKQFPELDKNLASVCWETSPLRKRSASISKPHETFRTLASCDDGLLFILLAFTRTSFCYNFFSFYSSQQRCGCARLKLMRENRGSCLGHGLVHTSFREWLAMLMYFITTGIH
jgi:hypothetical protein